MNMTKTMENFKNSYQGIFEIKNLIKFLYFAKSHTEAKKLISDALLTCEQWKAGRCNIVSAKMWHNWSSPGL